MAVCHLGDRTRRWRGRGGRGMGVPNRDGHRTNESSQTHFLGFVYCLVRLLDRRQPLRNVYLRRPAAVEGGMAETDYAHCGADDFHLRPDRNPVRFFSSRPCLAVVLPHSLSQSANHLAGLSLALDVGCHRRLHLCDGEYHLSLLALDSGFCACPRSRERLAKADLFNPRTRMARKPDAMASTEMGRNASLRR